MSRAGGREEGERRGLLIAFEGIDGTGKSTQIGLLSDKLQRAGLEVVVTREPTDGPHGRKLRALFSNRQLLSPDQELELFMADRRQHVRELIRPALAAGKLVLTDRYYLSTAAYQGARGHDPEQIIAANEAFAPVPDLVVLLELDPAQAVHRVEHLRGERLNDFEREEELRKVAAVFSSLDREYIQRLDGGGSVEEVHNEILGLVTDLLRRKGLIVNRSLA